MTPGEKLLRRVGETIGGLASRHLERIPPDETLVADVIEAILSAESKDASFGLFFAYCLRREVFSATDIERVVEAARQRVADADCCIREGAIEVLVRFRTIMPGYRDLMLAALRDPSALVRSLAVRAYSTYSLEMEIEPLLPFETDETMGEVAMGSIEQCYWLRDEALHQIERTLGTDFSTGYGRRNLEKGQFVRWRHWIGVHNWLARHAPRRPSLWSRVCSWCRRHLQGSVSAVP